MDLPPIVQGGMGIAVSGWQLASSVSRQGQFGVVSGTGVAVTFARRLQAGDPGHHLRCAMHAFPAPQVCERVMRRWFVEAGQRPSAAPARIPMPSYPVDPELVELTVLANFAEVYLARLHGGRGPIGLNLLTKIEINTLESLYGAMLAGVDAVFMGAGIPRLIPGVIDLLARRQSASIPLTVEGGAPAELQFDPRDFLGHAAVELPRPAFFPIVSSAALATILVRKSNGRIDGFVVEDHSAGGHNAPPRRGQQRNDRGEPVWGEQDEPSLEAFRELGLPFYVAGGRAHSMSLHAVRAQGAAGIQIGTAFAFCNESGILPELKTAVIQAAIRGEVDVITDPLASPTGFPFKVVQLPGTLSEASVYHARPRSCSLGYLRTAYRMPDGTLGWRCPAERESAFLAKGGELRDTVGRKCLCAGLAATVGIGADDQSCIVTAGDDVRQLARFMSNGEDSYSAEEVITSILAQNCAMDVVRAFVGRQR